MIIKRKKDSIFISIASYRDAELIPSILDCVTKAKNKYRLYFGICLQDIKKRYYLLKHIRKKHKLNMHIIFMDWRDSKGVCWARYLIQKKLYSKELYYLQIDSHSRFTEEWDELLIHWFNKKCQSGVDKPILTAYCPQFNSKTNLCKENVAQICTFDKFEQDGDLIFKPLILDRSRICTTDIPARFLSGHFLFTHGLFSQECLYDPNLYFRGEEITLSARAYTHGYQFFHPTFPIVWHSYTRLSDERHWDHHTASNGFIMDHKTRDRSSKERMRKLLGIENNDINFGIYGLGSKKTLHEYELMCGLDFKNTKIHQYCFNIDNKSPLPFIMSDLEWSKKMLLKKNITVIFPQEIINYFNHNIVFIKLQIFSHKDLILHETDILPTGLATIIKNNFQMKKNVGIADIPAYGIVSPYFNKNQNRYKSNEFIKTKEILYYDYE